jgi:hypothetical protein
MNTKTTINAKAATRDLVKALKAGDNADNLAKAVYTAHIEPHVVDGKLPAGVWAELKTIATAAGYEWYTSTSRVIDGVTYQPAQLKAAIKSKTGAINDQAGAAMRTKVWRLLNKYLPKVAAANGVTNAPKARGTKARKTDKAGKAGKAGAVVNAAVAPVALIIEALGEAIRRCSPSQAAVHCVELQRLAKTWKGEADIRVQNEKPATK